MTLHLALFELKLLLRRRITAFSVFGVPVLMCAMTWFSKEGMPPDRWGSLLGSQFIIVMMLSVYMVSTTVFTARRQALVLKRLRTTELTDNDIYIGVGAPIALVGTVQTVVFFGFCLAVGAPMPGNVLLVLVGVLAGVAVGMLGGIATAAFSRSVEATQVTAVPVLMAGVGGLILVQTHEFGGLLPVVGAGELVTKGWSGGSPVIGAAGCVLWLVVFGAVAVRYFRWEPRA
ncbi:hypothetical protein [Actinocrispum sp. NPDC049592]|uniref:ABC transporter permease n=1 Tax=Actinocrispum sp. NPDC049592 TaxID=3154835 RepID=UPI00341B0CB9